MIKVTFIDKVGTDLRNKHRSQQLDNVEPNVEADLLDTLAGLTTGINSGFGVLGAARPNDVTGVGRLVTAGFDFTASFDFSADCRGGRRRGRRGRGTWYISSPRRWEGHSGTDTVA